MWKRGSALALALVFLCATVRTARADGERELARQHWKAGRDRFNAGDFHGAILELAAADQLQPSPLLSYDIAVCHDRLGEREEAGRRYREYLRRRPDAPNRREVEQRLLGLAAAEPPIEAPPAETVPVRPPETPDGLSEPRSTDEPGPPPSQEPRRVPYDEAFARRIPGPSPSPSALPPPPQVAYGEQAPVQPPVPAQAMPQPERKGQKAFYKQWWFWVFVGVGAVILIDIASSGHDDDDAPTAIAPAPARGLTLIKF
jgi:hypothetical protein